jgi:putative hemolysin
MNSALIQQEIEHLSFGNLIASQANFDVFVAKAKQIPNVLNEIGRLRETTFRAVGEGTGKSLDLDEYDLYYLQLIIWDREERKIVGGYRLGKGDEIFARYGVEGFYINNFFKIDEGFYPIMQQAVELGRSYIVPDYQKKRLPLFLLWRGILFFLLQNPQYRYLYGPLSISKYYSEVSRSLIVEFVKRFFYDYELAKFLKPRKPFKVKTEKVDIDLLLQNMTGEMSALDNFIEDIEPSHISMPVLLKQYVKQNAKIIGFNVDPNFSDVLDGFMILDLHDVPYATIEALKKESGG